VAPPLKAITDPPAPQLVEHDLGEPHFTAQPEVRVPGAPPPVPSSAKDIEVKIELAVPLRDSQREHVAAMPIGRPLEAPRPFSEMPAGSRSPTARTKPIVIGVLALMVLVIIVAGIRHLTRAHDEDDAALPKGNSPAAPAIAEPARAPESAPGAGIAQVDHSAPSLPTQAPPTPASPNTSPPSQSPAAATASPTKPSTPRPKATYDPLGI
jgi:hypothetical protein